MAQNTRLTQILRNLASSDPELQIYAVKKLVHEARSMEKALGFYAEEINWIDGVAMSEEGESNQLEADEGFIARWALHLVDVVYGPYMPLEPSLPLLLVSQPQPVGESEE